MALSPVLASEATSSRTDPWFRTASSDSIPLLLENEVGNPYHIVLVFGVHPAGTDGFDGNLDRLPPPPPPMGWDFEAYFPLNHSVFKQLRTDIRSDQNIRTVWTIVTKGAEGAMTWYPGSFPQNGTLFLDDVVNMREVTSTRFAYRDTMTIAYSRGRPDIEIEWGSYDFGDVLLRGGEHEMFSIRNTGEGDLIVHSVTTDQADFAVVSPTSARGVVPAGSLEVDLLFAPSVLGLVTANVTILSSDEDEPALFVALRGTGVTPEIAVSSTSHDFGQVAMGASAEWEFNVFNEGTGILSVHNIGSSEHDFTVERTSFSVSPGDSERVQVRFSPGAHGVLSGQLAIASSDLDEPTVTVQVAGIGIGPEIEPSITYYEFGSVALGDSSLWTLILMNNGAAVLLVDTISCGRPEFVAAPRTFEVSPSQAQHVSVSFIPAVLGTIAGDLIIVSNDWDEPVLTISLSGTGVAQTFPDIYVATTVHDFGQVTTGQSALWNVDVTNLGSAELTISEIHADHAFFTADPTSFSLNPSRTQEVQITFAPTSTGPLFSQVFISSNDPDEPTVTLYLTGAGTSETGIEEMLFDHTPEDFFLHQNRPNPFNPYTEIGFLIPNVKSPIRATLTIYNLMGQQMRKLVDEPKGVGFYAVTWDGRDDLGRPVGSGIYYYSLHAGHYVKTRKMILLK